jgi:hypothetical protein
VVPVPLQPSYYGPENSTNHGEARQGQEKPVNPTPGSISEDQPGLQREHWYHTRHEAYTAMSTPRAMGAMVVLDIAMVGPRPPKVLAAATEQPAAKTDRKQRRERKNSGVKGDF